MNFNNYPLDSHTCGFWILSKHPSDIFKYTLDILDYQTDYQVRLLEYDFKVYGDVFKISYGPGLKDRYKAGFVISMDRKIQKYIVNQYVPSGLLVMISWVRLLVEFTNTYIHRFYSHVLHNTCHFNLTLYFQNWSLQRTLKMTCSLAKIKVAIVK